MKKGRQLLHCLPVLIVLILTFLLLTYVGYGEARRTYQRFQLRKMATQGEIIKNAFDRYLQAGLPLKQYSRFAYLSEGLLLSDDDIENIRVVDTNGQTIFLNIQKPITEDQIEKQISRRSYKPNPEILENKECRVMESEASFQVELALKSKFGIAGYLVIESEKEAIFEKLNQEYKKVFLIFGIFSSCFVIFIQIYEAFSSNKQKRKAILNISYIIGFLSISIVIAVTVLRIYEYGAKANTKVLADSMAQRMKAIIELGINFEDISGINEAFHDYKDCNPDIHAIALTENGISIFHTNKDIIGMPYVSMKDRYEYVAPIKSAGKKIREFKVAVSIPNDIVMKAVISSAKNLIVLFITCGLISLIFLDAGTGLLAMSEVKDRTRIDNIESVKDSYFRIGLNLIKPAYFMVVFIQAMSISFLPQLVTKMAAESGSSIASASLPFSVYYLLFATVLIPAGRYAQTGSLKRLMGVGFVAEIFGLLLVAITKNYWILVIGRGLSGVGQGLFLIGLQSYLLVVTPEDKRTQGTAVKVIGRNSGLISGTAIGALLYVYIDYNRLFLLASILSLVGLIYLLTLVPEAEAIKREEDREKDVMFRMKARQFAGRRKGRMLRNITSSLKDAEFLKTLALIGLIGKMGVTGIVMFAIPLIMARQHFAIEDIGLALMLYYISSMAMTRYASVIVDRVGTARLILFASSITGGIGMFVLGFIGVEKTFHIPLIPGFSNLSSFAVGFNELIMNSGIQDLGSYLILLCLILMGISNGLLAAPVITHISKTDIAVRFDSKSITATYIFLERFGHVVGPMAISQILIFTNQSTLSISLFGIITAVAGCIFLVSARKRQA